jgi:hypothetical protein
MLFRNCLENPLSKGMLIEKLKTVKDGRHCPHLLNHNSVHKDKETHKEISRFAVWFLSVDSSLQKCEQTVLPAILLFSKSDCACGSEGFDNFTNLRTSQKKKITSATHLQCTLDLLHFGH